MDTLNIYLGSAYILFYKILMEVTEDDLMVLEEILEGLGRINII